MHTTTELRSRWRPCGRALMRSGGVFDWDARRADIVELERRSTAPDLWDDPAAAQDVMQRLARLSGELEAWRSLDDLLTTTAELIELAEDEPAMLEGFGRRGHAPD